MITLYSGTPGSGKSLHAARDIYYRLLNGKSVISTFNINTNVISKNGKRKIGKFTHCPYSDFTVDFLKQYANENHIRNRESQTVVFVDECQLIYNPRQFNSYSRLEWISFFTQHRHLGYDFILITQFDRLIDRQIRCLIEFEYKHIKMNHKGFIGMLLPIALFTCHKYWYCVRELIGSDAFFFNKKYASIYDTFAYDEAPPG